MQVVLYENGTHEAGKKLWNIIGSQVAKTCTERFSTIDSFSQKLRQPMNGISIAVLLSTTKDELQRLVLLGDLLGSIQIILVLPDRSAEILSLGLQLRTSYISEVDGNVSDVGSVLKQILQKKDER